jgi:hypothetical protein
MREVGRDELMGGAALEKRVRALEASVPAIGEQCRCRAGRQTRYHTAEELKRILDVRCPLHGFRDLGRLRRVGSGIPLLPEDQDLCSCPPSPIREFLQGRRGPLTEVEQAAEERSWEGEFTPAAKEDFRRDQAWARQLLQKYEYSKRQRGKP